MIQSFFQSWELFHYAYLAGWLMGIQLAMLGVIVVARDQIFLGAAVSQASMGGIALGMAGGYWLGASETAFIRSDAFLAGVAAVFAVGAALLTARGGRRGRETHEAITGWVFLLGGAGSVLLLVHSPHGLEEIHRLAASSIIGADGIDVAAFGALTVLSALALFRFRRAVLVMTIDPAMGPAVGVRTHAWAFAWAAWLGLSVSMSIRSAGMLYAFGSLVLPAMLSKRLCREVGPMFWTAPLLHFGAALPGFVLANHYDLPPAQVVVVLLCAALLPTLRR